MSNFFTGLVYQFHFSVRRLFLLSTVFMGASVLVGCSSSVTSDVLSKEQIQTMADNIAIKHPDANGKLRRHILNVAVKTLENMAFVEGGSFMMGDFGMPCSFDNFALVEWSPDVQCASDGSAIDNGSIHLHKVTLSSYSLAKYETTYYEMNAYRLAHQLPLIKPDFNEERFKKPTPTKTWQEAKDYCTWVGEVSGYPVDLPTEAQWEYAARNRGQNIYFATNDGTMKREGDGYYARLSGGGRKWHDWKPEEWNYPRERFSDVGSWPPNPLGIYNLSDNSIEWVNDWFSADYYKNSPEQDPQGPATGTNKVQRGPQGDRPIVTTRYVGENKDKYYLSYGFRCALQQTAKVQ